jgi:hypothetical protein
MSEQFSGKLFVNEEYYSFYLAYYIIIVAERLKKYDIGLKMYDIIFTKKNINPGEWWVKNLVFNFQFFIDKNKEVSLVNKWNQYLSLINDRKYNIDKNLVNKYELYNVSNFLQVCNSVTDLSYGAEVEPFIVIAILAKDKEFVLPYYLNCIYNQTYNKKKIHLYIRTNDNKDKTEELLTQFIEKYGEEYASVHFLNNNVSEDLKKYSNHEWNLFRFKILGKIRQESVQHAIDLKAHYFTADCDNFITPTTIEKLVQCKNLGVVAPMLKTGYSKDIQQNVAFSYNNESYSNYHYDVDDNGYYKTNNKYYSILNKNVTGLTRVCCVHCSYFIPFSYLSVVNYDDNSNRHEYVIFSDVLRKNGIPQYIDNREKYGCLTFSEEKEVVDLEYDYWKTHYSFVPINIELTDV